MYFLVSHKTFQYFDAYLSFFIIIFHHFIKKITLTDYRYEFYFNSDLILIKRYSLIIFIIISFIHWYSNHFDIKINEFFC